MNNLEPLINTTKIKFNELRDIFKTNKINVKKINLYIDLDNLIINKLLDEANRAVLLSLKGKDKSVISLSAEIINIAAHYRLFLSKMNIMSSIIFYSASSNKKMYKDYMELREESNPVTGSANTIINSNLSLISTVVPYIPKVYYVPVEKISPTRMIKWISRNVDESELNMILTNDKTYHSLVNKNTVVLRRIYGHPASLITKNNVYEKRLSKIKYKPDNNLSHKYIKLFTACSSSKIMGLKKVKGCTFVKLCKNLDSLINDGFIENGECNITTLLSLLSLNDEQREDIKNNYSLLYDDLDKLEKYNIMEHMKNRMNNDALMELNRKYYFNNNLQLIELFS